MSDPVELKEKPKRGKALMEKLLKSKNFHKEDRNLDDYIDRTKLLNGGEKRMLKKLIKLRARENADHVKVTVSGLSRLLAINIKTARRNLKGLADKGFLYQQPDEWKDGQRYPKKFFLFPETFPGFDTKLVFVRRGDKRRHNQKQARKTSKVINPKSASFTPKSTYPIRGRLVDCCITQHNSSNQNCVSNATWTLSQENKFSYERDPVAAVDSAKPNRRGSCEKSNSRKCDSRKVTFHHHGLADLFKTLLSNRRIGHKMIYLSRFYDQCVETNGFLETEEDRREIADLIYTNLGEFYGSLHTRNKQDVFGYILKMLKDTVLNYVPDRYFRDDELFAQVFGHHKGECKAVLSAEMTLDAGFKNQK